MRHTIIALMLLVGSVWSAHAGPLIGAGHVPVEASIVQISCQGDDRQCSAGLYWGCSRSRGCQCYICGTNTAFNDYYYSQRRYSPPAPPPSYSRPRYYYEGY